ncbi:MAG: FadR family transcriptional regulator [Spirochaetales bacterium]|nr:FadR family transcriptional regulator [Spirochaetales bacterium]
MEKDLTEEFITLIKTKILKGEFGIGTPLPSLRELSEQYGYSRAVVNVAIAKLVSQGYILSKKRKMNIINDYLNYGKIEVISDMVFSDNKELGFKALNDIVEARELIETESVRKACESSCAADFHEIELIISEENRIKTISSANLELASDLDYRFHWHLVKLSGNIVYRLAFNEFSEFAKAVTKQYFQNHPDTYLDVVRSHERLVASMKKQNITEALVNLDVMLAGGDQRYKEKNPLNQK